MAGRPGRKFEQPRIPRNKRMIRGEKGRLVHSLTPEVHELIIKHVATGVSVETAAAAVGVTLATLRRWLIRGRDALMADEVPEGEQIFADLAHDIDGVLARFEIDELERIARHGDYDWRASAWKLEHIIPQKYGRRSTVEIGNARGEPFRIDAAPLDAVALEQLEEFRKMLARMRGSLPAEEIVDAEFTEVKEIAAA